MLRLKITSMHRTINLFLAGLFANITTLIAKQLYGVDKFRGLHEIQRYLWNRKAHYGVYTMPACVRIPSQKNQGHIVLQSTRLVLGVLFRNVVSSDIWDLAEGVQLPAR
jgi:hypothetical protein